MKLTHYRKWLLSTLLSCVIFGSFLFASLISWKVWISPILALLSATGLTLPIWWRNHYRHSSKKEKERMGAQKSFNSYYYNRWYTPADSTEMDYEIEQIKKRKKSLKLH